MAITLEAGNKYRAMAGLPPLTPEQFNAPTPSPSTKNNNDAIIAQRKAALGITDTPVTPTQTQSATDPTRPLPGADTALLPAKPASQTGTGLVDLSKTAPNALKDAVDLVKEGTYGTAKKVLYDIPKEAYGLATDKNEVVHADQKARDLYLKKTGIDVYADPLDSQNKLGNLAEGTVESIPKVAWGMVPQSAKELANTDALAEIPTQFKALVKENGGSYAKALQAMVEAIPGSLPDAALNYASQIDRARQSVENHPLNEYLGYLGLKSLVGGEIPDTSKSKILNTPALEVPKETIKAIPGAKMVSDVAGKMARRVSDARATSEELSKQPDSVKTAVKADIPQPQATLINEANPQEKSLMSEMLDKQKNGTKKLIMEPEERPDSVIGREAMKTIKFLEDQKKSASIQEGEHVKNLSNKPIDFSGTVNDFMDRLATMGVKMGENGRLDFTKSELSTPASAKDRGLLQLTADELKPDENGKYKKSADELHTTRQRLFNETQNKNFTEPFTDRVVSMVHNDMGTSVRSGLLHDISKQAGDTGKGYESTVTKNAKIQDALQTFYKLVGKDTGARETNIKNLGVGEVANRLEGNASAKVENAFNKVEETAKKYGYDSKVSIRKLVAFKTILKNIVGETQHNSLAGGVEQGSRAALPSDVADVAGNALSGKVGGTIKAVGKFIKSNTKAEQVRAIQELLNDTNKASSPIKGKKALLDTSIRHIKDTFRNDPEEDVPF